MESSPARSSFLPSTTNSPELGFHSEPGVEALAGAKGRYISIRSLAPLVLVRFAASSRRNILATRSVLEIWRIVVFRFRQSSQIGNQIVRSRVFPCLGGKFTSRRRETGLRNSSSITERWWAYTFIGYAKRLKNSS